MEWSNLQLGSITELSHNRHVGREELAQSIEARMRELTQLGARPGHGLFIYQQNCSAFFINLLAGWRLGLCVIPLDAGLPFLAREHLRTSYQPRVIVDPQGALQIGAADAFVWPGDSALLLMSSGSTGRAKGILHSRLALQAKMQSLAQALPTADMQRVLCALPTHFGHGLICNSLFPLLQGAHLYLSPPFGPQTIARLDDLIIRDQIRFFSTTPVIWEMIAQFANYRPKPSLKRVHCASADLLPQHIANMRAWADGATLWNVYGLTEMLGWISLHQLNDEPFGIGRPWDAEVVLREERLFVRAPYQMRAYVEMGAQPELRTVAPNDWISTGDLAILQGKGTLQLKGRHDFLINKGGCKIDPQRIEEVCREYPSVLSAYCFGFPDTLWGEKTGLALETEDNWCEDEFRRFLTKRLSSLQMPDRILRLSGLPRTARGKVDRENLRRQALEI